MKKIQSKLSSQHLNPTDQKVWDEFVESISKVSNKSLRHHYTVSPPKISYFIDLHGLKLNDAFIAVKKFLTMHFELGTKQVQIITGKRGSMSRELPIWCEQFPSVSKIQPIYDSTGSCGSYKIYLKRRQ